jgi:hypothetical protein
MKSDSYLTPPEILQRLGEFDLDPCCPPEMPWKTANRMISLPEDGLHASWEGRVWLNPPFGSVATEWLRKMALHGNGIALIPARTETRMFYECVWGQADGLLFIRGRPHFHYPDGKMASFNSGAPISLIAYGKHNVSVLDGCGLGVCVSWDRGKAGEGVSVAWEQHKNQRRQEH